MKRRVLVMDRETLAAEIASLSKLGIDELRERWKAAFGKAPSRDISRLRAPERKSLTEAAG